jgi:peptidyl-tRNA hydrolase
MRGRKLSSGVNWQEAFKQKCLKQTGVKQELDQLKYEEIGSIKRKLYLVINTNFLNISGAKFFLMWDKFNYWASYWNN